MRLRASLSFCLLLFWTTRVLATSVRALEIEELVRQSQQIFLGRVVGIQYGTVPGFDLEYTEYTLAVSDWIKGTASSTVKIRQLGRLGKPSLAPGLPTYKKGEEALLFVHAPSAIGLTSPVGMQQGYYRVERDLTGERYVRAGAMMPSIIRLQSGSRNSSRPAGEARAADQVPLEDFLSLVRQVARQ